MPATLLQRRGIESQPGGLSAFGTLIADWDFSKLGLNDGDAIASVPDQSGVSGAAVQATGANKPTFKTAIQNGLGIGRFAGSHWLSVPVALFNASGDIAHIFAVVKGSSTVVYDYFGNRDATGGWIMRLNAGAGGSLYGHILNGNANGPASTTTNWHLHQAKRLAANNATAYTDGVAGTGSPTGYTPNATAESRIGSPGPISNNLFSGDIGEIVAFSALADEAGARAFLKAKWGTP